MSVLSSAVNGLTKAEAFLLALFTKGSQVSQIASKLSPAVLAAMLAVFYDILKAVQTAIAAATAAESANLPAAFQLSATTLALVKQVAVDGKAGEQLIVSDLQALGILKPAAAH